MLLGIRAKIRNGAMLAYREKFGLSQSEAAKLAGVSMELWSIFECMRFHNTRATPRSAEKIAIAVGVDLEQIAPPELAGKRFETVRTRYADVSTTNILEAKTTKPPLLSCEHEVEELKEGLESVLKTLTRREREILKLRFGIDGPTYSSEEVGRIFKVTGQRVRQIEAQAISRLQHPSRAKRLKEFICADGDDQ